MSPQRIHIIRIVLVLVVVLAFAGTNVYTFLQLREHRNTINAQGTLLRLMVETPEINTVIKNELIRRQSATSTPQK